MLYLRFFLFVFLFSILQAEVTAQENNFKYEDDYSQFVNNQMELDKIPGLTIGFQHGDQEWVKGFGYIDLENNVEASPTSVYRLASNSKSMAAVAILQLAEENKLELDDPVQKYVSYFPEKKWEIPIRYVLGHLGGISHYKNYEEEGSIKEPKDTRESIEIFADFELVAEPGTEYSYSSYGYNLLGAAIEGAAKTPYGQYMKENIWEPLDMESTYMDDPDEIVPGRAKGYRLVFNELRHSEYVDISSRFAGGGKISSIPDMLKYAEGLNKEKILTGQSTRLMETPMKTKDGEFIGYGMGWRIAPVNGHFMVYHTGAQPETRTILIRFPEKEFNIACAYNFEGGDLNAFPRRLYQLVMDEGWNVKPYTTDKYDKTVIDGLWEIYNYGLAHFERYNTAKSSQENELIQIFEFFNNTFNRNALKEDFDSLKTEIQLGRHPKANMAFVKMGSYMAEQLYEEYGKDQLDEYHKNGAFKFFEDYIQLLESDEDSKFQIDVYIKEQIAEYSSDWSNSWNQYTRRLWIAPHTDLDQQTQEILKLFENKDVYPDFTGELSEAIWKGTLDSEPDDYLKVAQRFTKLYPESAIPQVTLMNLYVLMDKKEEASKALELASEAKTDKNAFSAGHLNSYAYQLFQANKLDKALSYIEFCREHYPEKGIFEDTKGDILLEKSRRAYEKALDLDPTRDNTWEQLKNIE
ncbi:MAG: serine hydrolase [Bacteroidales bacterium]